MNENVIRRLFPNASKSTFAANRDNYTCEECGEPFRDSPSANRKFCSTRCAYNNENRLKTISSKQRKIRGTSVCKKCGQLFELKTRGGETYCSQACAASDIGKKTIEANRKIQPKDPSKRQVFTCKTCGTTFERYKNNGNPNIYCSNKCGLADHIPLHKRVASFQKGNRENLYSRCARGWRTIGEQKIFARSKWEANYGRYLEFQRVWGQISLWEHEPETFWFNEIKRGALSYLPDFRVTLLDGTKEYHEVKGWMDARSKTKLRRMAKFYPDIKVVLRDQQWFKANKNKLKLCIPNWE